jgi:hypothetical protein
MLGDDFSEHMTAIVVPPPAFTRGAKGVLIEMSAVFRAATGIPFGDVPTNGTQSPIKLIGQADRPPVFEKLADISPPEVGSEKCQPIDFKLPQWVALQPIRNRILPLSIVHLSAVVVGHCARRHRADAPELRSATLSRIRFRDPRSVMRENCSPTSASLSRITYHVSRITSHGFCTNPPALSTPPKFTRPRTHFSPPCSLPSRSSPGPGPGRFA